MPSVAEWLAEFLRVRGATRVFCVTGGYAQYLNRAFGEALDVVYTQTEQAAGYAAYAHAKQTGRPAVVCVTAGCGATNTLTAVVDAYQDSVPVFYVSGQVNQAEVVLSRGTRHHMGAWCDIVPLMAPATKLAVEPASGAEAVDAIPGLYRECCSGRPGPVWLSLPLDVQRAHVEVAVPSPAPTAGVVATDGDAWSRAAALLRAAERPVVLLGGGAAGTCREHVRRTVEAWGIPCVFTFMGLDVLPTDHPLYCGRPGAVGDRCGNLVMQNADVIVALGSRVAGMVIGYNRETFAREATLCVVTADVHDLRLPRPTDFAVQADLGALLGSAAVEGIRGPEAWRERCAAWKARWFQDVPAPLPSPGGPYQAMAALLRPPATPPPPTTYIHASGSTYNIVWHMLRCRADDRFLCSSQGDMGFEMCAAVGVAAAGQTDVVAFMGDASFHFNVQELQTLVRMPRAVRVTLVVFDNDGLQSIALSQKAAFGTTYGSDAGTGAALADIDRVCAAFGVPCTTVDADRLTPDTVYTGPPLHVVRVRCLPQQRHPKLAVIYDADGKPTALPLEDMRPLVPWDEFRATMAIPPLVRPDVQ